MGCIDGCIERFDTETDGPKLRVEIQSKYREKTETQIGRKRERE